MIPLPVVAALIVIDLGTLIENLATMIAAVHLGLVIAVGLLLVLIFKIDLMQLQHLGHQLVICN